MYDPKKNIRQLYKPGIKSGEKKDLAFVYQRYTDMKQARSASGIEQEWDKWQKQYDGYRDEKALSDWQSNIIVNTTAGVVESQLSEAIDQNYRIKYLPRGPEDKPKATVMNAVSDYTWEVGMADVELYKTTKDALILGTSIAQEYFRKEKRMVQQIMSTKKDGTQKFKDVEINDFDNVYFEHIRLQDIWFDEYAKGITGTFAAKDCVRRIIMDIDDFQNFFKGPIWDKMDNAKYVKPGGDVNYYEYYKPPQGIDTSRQVEVLWYWGIRPTPGRPKYSDHLIVVANDVVVVHGPNPYNHKRLPFVRQVDILNAGTFYGKGESALLESIQEEQTVLRRMVIDRNHLDIDKMFLLSNRETDIDEDDLIARPHALINVEDVDNIKPLEYGDVPNSTFQSLEMLGDDAVRITGQDDRMQSVSSPTTATQAAILKEATLKRLRTKLWLLRNLTLYNVGILRESNIRQFYSVPKVEKIVGEKGTANYYAKVRNAYQSGRLSMKDGEPHEKKYRTIRLDDKKLVVDKNGVQLLKSKEPTFFEATPDLINPMYGSFNVKTSPMPQIPISQPLMQEKTSAMFDRLIQMPDIYSPEKLGDALLEVHDFDPDEFKPEKKPAEKMDDSMIQKSLQVAQAENQEMMKGKQIPPTPYAMEPHTETHIALINSPEVMALPNESPILANLVRHIEGELQSQEHKKSAMQKQPGMEAMKAPSGPSAPSMGNEAMGEMNPDMALPPEIGNEQGASVNPNQQL